MKLLHLGDLHIGRSLGEFDLAEDQKYILDQITDIAVRNAVDAVIIAGDVYDRADPSEKAVSLFNDFLSRLARLAIRVFIISGNHDSDERLNFGSSLFTASGIFIAAKYDGTLSRYTLEDEYGAVNIWLMPFVKASRVRHFYPDAEIKNYDDAVRTVLKNGGIDPGQRNILAAHQFVVNGAVNPAVGGSESASTLNVGLVERIDAGCFDAFDYVALGHIHSAQAVGREQVRYSGSPLKYSLSEAANEKSAALIELKEKGNVSIKLEALRPLRDLRHIRGRLEQLLAKENIVSPDDFIYATLTDEDPIDNAMGIMQQYYPNTVRIEYCNSHTRELQEGDALALSGSRSFGEIIADFYRLMYQCEISEEELALIKEAAREAGAADETD